MKTAKYLAAIFLLLTASLSMASPNNLNTSLNDVLKSYFGIKNALVVDDYKTANSEAKKFTAALKLVQVNQMDAIQKAAWEKYAEKLRFDGEHISETTVVVHQREHFTSLSTNMFAVVKAFHANDVAVYQQYCPMVRKSWLSESATIKNPYLGKTEPTCGVVKETLKASK